MYNAMSFLTALREAIQAYFSISMGLVSRPILRASKRFLASIYEISNLDRQYRNIGLFSGKLCTTIPISIGTES